MSAYIIKCRFQLFRRHIFKLTLLKPLKSELRDKNNRICFNTHISLCFQNKKNYTNFSIIWFNRNLLTFLKSVTKHVLWKIFYSIMVDMYNWTFHNEKYEKWKKMFRVSVFSFVHVFSINIVIIMHIHFDFHYIFRRFITIFYTYRKLIFAILL